MKSMDQKVHKILQDAGVAKGITKDEVMILMVLGSPKLLQEAKKKIAEKMSGDELRKTLETLDEMANKYRQAQQKTVGTVVKKKKELEEELMQKKIVEIKEENQKLESIARKIDVFLSR